LRSGEVYYLDTSALVKRYLDEPGSSTVDALFDSAHKGMATLALSYWNLAEASVVFDKYERRIGVKARALLRMMLGELRVLARMQSAVVVGVSPKLLRESIRLVLEHHIYVADALQIATAKKAQATVFVTGDKGLAEIAEAEGLKPLYTG